MKNLRKLSRKDLQSINGGDQAYAICDQNGVCPRPYPGGAGSYYCINGLCYRSSSNSGGSGGCTEPKRLCSFWEIGCGCVY